MGRDYVAVDQAWFGWRLIGRADNNHLIDVGHNCMNSPSHPAPELTLPLFDGLDGAFPYDALCLRFHTEPHSIAHDDGLPLLDQPGAKDPPHGARPDTLPIVHIRV